MPWPSGMIRQPIFTQIFMHKQLFTDSVSIYSLFQQQVVEDGYEFFAKRQLVTLFSAPNYCGEFDNAGGMMTVDESLLCSFQVSHLQTTTTFLLHVAIDLHSKKLIFI